MQLKFMALDWHRFRIANKIAGNSLYLWLNLNSHYFKCKTKDLLINPLNFCILSSGKTTKTFNGIYVVSFAVCKFALTAVSYLFKINRTGSIKSV